VENNDIPKRCAVIFNTVMMYIMFGIIGITIFLFFVNFSDGDLTKLSKSENATGREQSIPSKPTTDTTASKPTTEMWKKSTQMPNRELCLVMFQRILNGINNLSYVAGCTEVYEGYASCDKKDGTKIILECNKNNELDEIEEKAEIVL